MKRPNLAWICLVFPSLMFFPAHPVVADTIHVPGDQPTIQAGIDAAQTGDLVLVAPGTFTGPSNRNLTFRGKNIIVRGSDGPDLTVIDCQGVGRGFMLRDGETHMATIDGFTIKDGFAFQQPGGGIYALLSSPTVTNCIFTLNRARDGGGFACQNQSSPIVTDCTFIENEGSTGGGLWSGFGTTLSVERCAFLRNFASGVVGAGGGLAAEAGYATITDCTFVGNRAHNGGAVAIGSAYALITRCTLVGNTAALYGGGISMGSSLELRNTIIAFNTNGGAALCPGPGYGEPLVFCSDIYGNAGGDWEGCLADDLGQHGNIRLDPLFCDVNAQDFTLHEGSPCAPENAGACGQIGAWPVGCGVTAVEPVTWGQIKFRAGH